MERYAKGIARFSEQDIPVVPTDMQLADGEVVLLAVYLPGKDGMPGYLTTLDAWWDFAVAPGGLKKTRWWRMKSDPDRIRLLPGAEWKPGIRWGVFDPNSYQDESCESAVAQAERDGITLAGTEVVNAVALFPAWACSWDGEDCPYPNAAALQVYFLGRWCLSVCLSRWIRRRPRGLRLLAYWSGQSDCRWTSPSVREC